MRIQVASPCYLQLGFARAVDGNLGELGIALQHPPIHLAAQPAEQLLVSGARADVAYRAAARYLAQLGAPVGSQVEIELAIPAFMGLGSDGMLRISVEQALRHMLRATEAPAAEAPVVDPFYRAFERGGLLFVSPQGKLIRRAAIEHADEEDDWVFVLVLPHAPDDVAEDDELQRRRALRDAAGRLSSSVTADALFAAVERDDFDAFAGALTAIHAANEAALSADGRPAALGEQERDILACMRAGGAAFAGRALTGLGLLGLIKGGPASRALRQALVRRLGYFGPSVMASICDNRGARVITG
ncbi:MAG: hypothetical protein K6U78_01990 [Anaerolineae bacterium]|nr:hypothetical protein [Anaerolineae bacterium]